jgi:hypothetical protein
MSRGWICILVPGIASVIGRRGQAAKIRSGGFRRAGIRLQWRDDFKIFRQHALFSRPDDGLGG